ncbi:TRHDE protein, partial [Polypterus senegalus]
MNNFSTFRKVYYGLLIDANKKHPTVKITQTGTLLFRWPFSKFSDFIQLLNLSLSSDLLPNQDVIDVIIHVARNPHGRHLAWKYFRDKWDILNSRYGEALFINSKLINGVTEYLTTEAELNELKHFVRNNGGGTISSFQRALEIVEANVRWHSLFEEQFFQWLRKSLTS